MKFAADENFRGPILNGLKQRLPNIDVIRIQDTSLVGSPDPELLAWLDEEGRILLTHDVKTIPKYVYDRIKMGLGMPGVIEINDTMPNREAIDQLEVVIGAGKPEDFEYLIIYLPL